MTTKEPAWRDPLVRWDEHPLTLGEAHEGFFYPDPLGFWAEVRRWAAVLVELASPGWTIPDVLSVTSLVHLSGGAGALATAMAAFRPTVVLFLDERSWEASGLEVERHNHYVTDPHRPKQVYEGFWGRLADGTVVGKAPQHPTTHNLYRADDMTGFLEAAPVALAPGGDAS